MWPKKVKFYTHSYKESGWEQGKEIGLTDDAADDFSYTGGEVCFDLLVNEDGSSVATHINGVALVTPVPI
jgi:hypothetical protein